MRLTEQTYKDIHGKIGMVFQNFQLFDNMTVIENLTFLVYNIGGERSEGYGL